MVSNQLLEANDVGSNLYTGINRVIRGGKLLAYRCLAAEVHCGLSKIEYDSNKLINKQKQTCLFTMNLVDLETDYRFKLIKKCVRIKPIIFVIYLNRESLYAIELARKPIKWSAYQKQYEKKRLQSCIELDAVIPQFYSTEIRR